MYWKGRDLVELSLENFSRKCLFYFFSPFTELAQCWQVPFLLLSLNLANTMSPPNQPVLVSPPKVVPALPHMVDSLS